MKKLLFLSASALAIFSLNACKKDNGEKPLKETTLWVVGDSTVCDYGKYDSNGNKTSITDTTYFYDRYGYATQFSNFLSEKVTVKNIALSGRSSLSFKSESNYSTLTNSIKEGDYLVIGFGHNDEKSDDLTRFASANQATTVEGSFKYNLYNYYIKVAQDAGATPILCSPIVRASATNDYSGSNGHVTANGDYANAVVELGSEKNVQVVDLTNLTKTLYTTLGYNEAMYFHAMTSGLDDNTPNPSSIDTTHINIYGAKMVSYMFMNEINSSKCSLKDYITNTNKPNKDTDLVKNSLFKYVPYSTPNFAEYKQTVTNGIAENPVYENFTTISEGWVGTAFGDLGGSPLDSKSGHIAKETEVGVFKVGQGNSTGTTRYKGKIASASEGRAYVIKQVSINDNFVFEADACVSVFNTEAGKQSGFGLVLRDECYLTNANEKSIGLGNSYNAGFITKSSGVGVIYSRESGTFSDSACAGDASIYTEGSTAHLKIERVGQIVTCTVTYLGQEYTKTYTDVDLRAMDNDYMYIGMYGTRGTIVDFTNVIYTKTGTSQGA